MHFCSYELSGVRGLGSACLVFWVRQVVVFELLAAALADASSLGPPGTQTGRVFGHRVGWVGGWVGEWVGGEVPKHPRPELEPKQSPDLLGGTRIVCGGLSCPGARGVLPSRGIPVSQTPGSKLPRCPGDLSAAGYPTLRGLGSPPPGLIPSRSQEARRVWLNHLLRPMPEFLQLHVNAFLPAVPVPRVRGF